MLRFLDRVFLAVQWLLLAYGLMFLVAGAHAFVMLDWPQRDVAPALRGDYYIIPWLARFQSYTLSGLIALGLSGVLFGLRKIHLRERPDDLSRSR